MNGHSLIHMMLFVIVSSLVLIGITKMVQIYGAIEQEEVTEQNMDVAYKALLDFHANTGRYPCPAPINAAIDSANFGKSVANCLVPSSGVVTAANDNGGIVASGALPVRTLNLPDNNSFDFFDKRLTYAISARYTEDPTSEEYSQNGEITIIDRQNNLVTSEGEDVVFTVIAHGEENEGAYSLEGELIEPCNADNYFGENCDNDALFTHSAINNDVAANQYISKLKYRAEDACKNSRIIPERVGFLLDASSSMRRRSAICPPGVRSCNRFTASIWTLNRVMVSRMEQSQTIDDAYTGLATFPPSRTEFRDEFEDVEDVSQIYQLCTLSGTPLGENLILMADSIGSGTENNPNVITIISDGRADTMSPTVAARRIKENHPHLTINVIDVLHTPSIASVAEITGGTYVRPDSIDSFLDELKKTFGGCEGDNSSPIPDGPYCQRPPPETP